MGCFLRTLSGLVLVMATSVAQRSYHVLDGHEFSNCLLGKFLLMISTDQVAAGKLGQKALDSLLHGHWLA